MWCSGSVMSISSWDTRKGQGRSRNADLLCVPQRQGGAGAWRLRRGRWEQLHGEVCNPVYLCTPHQHCKKPRASQSPNILQKLKQGMCLSASACAFTHITSILRAGATARHTECSQLSLRLLIRSTLQKRSVEWHSSTFYLQTKQITCSGQK